MKFAVIGTGGVGGVFGGRLALGGQEVWFVARGAHLAAMREGGLHLHSPDGTSLIPPGRMTDDATRIGRSDVVLFCVKSYDTIDAARHLLPLLGEDTVIITLQNGIDSERHIRQVVPSTTIFPGVAYVYASITGPGEITEVPGPRKLLFGASSSTTDPGRRKQGEEVMRMMVRSGVSAEWTNAIELALWKKFIFIASVSGLTALTRLTLGEILVVHPTRQLLFDAMAEVHALGTRLNISLDPDYVLQLFARMDQFSHETRSSLYHDLLHNKPLELEALSGTVVRLAASCGLPTPIHATFYRALLPYALRHARRKEDE